LASIRTTGNINESSWNDIFVLGISSGHALGDASPLFARVEESDIEKHKKQLALLINNNSNSKQKYNFKLK